MKDTKGKQTDGGKVNFNLLFCMGKAFLMLVLLAGASHATGCLFVKYWNLLTHIFQRL